MKKETNKVTAKKAVKKITLTKKVKAVKKLKYQVRLKTFADVCKDQNMKISDVIPFTEPINQHHKNVNAYAVVGVIADAINEGWKPDWNNVKQYKYWPWMKYQGSGSGFAYSNYDDWLTCTFVGSRLCFETSEKAMYFAKQFQKEFNEYLLNQ